MKFESSWAQNINQPELVRSSSWKNNQTKLIHRAEHHFSIENSLDKAGINSTKNVRTW